MQTNHQTMTATKTKKEKKHNVTYIAFSKASKAFLYEKADMIKQEGSNFYIEDGDNVIPLDQAVDSFLNTDFGMMFQPASKGRGMNSKAPSGNQSNPSKRKAASLNSMLLQPEES